MRLTDVPSSALRALLRREAATTLRNRFVQVFALVVLGGAAAVVALSGRSEGVPYGLLLLLLYVVPLFGLLTGVSAAHEEHDERAFLWSQPMPRAAFVLSKTAVLVGALAIVLLGVFVAAAAVGTATGTLALLWGLGLVLVLVSVSGGVAMGQYVPGRARGIMAALVAWFGSFALYDAVALALSGVEVVQSTPAFWVGLLLLNPLDAVRLTGLFGLENIPFSAPGTAAWLTDLLAWLPAWTAVLAVGWTILLLGLACRRATRLDL